jgi:hypothetical protein
MRKMLAAVAAVSMIGLTTQARAGGQQVVAQVSADGQSLVVRTYRCGTPASLTLRGTAEGLVNGERRTLVLEAKPGSEPGVFSVARQWPAEGRWALVFGVSNGKAEVSSLVVLEPGSPLRIADQRMTFDRPSAERIDDALARGTAVASR